MGQSELGWGLGGTAPLPSPSPPFLVGVQLLLGVGLGEEGAGQWEESLGGFGPPRAQPLGLPPPPPSFIYGGGAPLGDTQLPDSRVRCPELRFPPRSYFRRA
jgi:hypothetical protein